MKRVSARLHAAVRLGDEQIERGETVPYSRELMGQIGQSVVQRAKQGKKIDNPDVLPSPVNLQEQQFPLMTCESVTVQVGQWSCCDLV